MNPSNESPSLPGSSPEREPDYPGQVAAAARENTQTLKGAAAATAHELKAQAAGTAAHLKERAAEMADEQKREVASRLGGYSSALRNAGKSIESDDPNIAWFSEEAANRLQAVADYVRQRDFHGLRVDAENFARRHPAVLFGGMFVTGLLLGSALRAGRSALHAAEENEEWDDFSQDPEISPGPAMTSGTPIAPESSEI